MNQAQYPIGTPGQKWTANDKQDWFAVQTKKRSYEDEVVCKLRALPELFECTQYGELSYAESHYPLFVVKSAEWDSNKPTILVTGGVHGYETSGVQGAIRFLQTAAARYVAEFNVVVAPCVSPWGYETINRWNPLAIDPNRSFYADGPAPESSQLMAFVKSLGCEIAAHIDLHETTDTDNSEFRPALASRDATVHDNWNIPDGFYLVADTLRPEPDFQMAIVDAVKNVTHIAPADENDKLIGVPLAQFGVINYAAKELGLCMGLTDAKFVTTTEVYPDSESADDENCILAQVAAITSGLDFVLKNKKS